MSHRRCVIQLVSPAHLFTEISRILRPGGIFLYLDSPPFSLCTSSSSSSFRPGIRGFRDAYDRAAWSRGDRSVVRDGGKAFRSMMDCAPGLRIIGGGEMKIPLSGWSGSGELFDEG
jgi:SAM-dependent methyltransferase